MKTPNPNLQPSTDRPSDTGPTAETAAPSTAAARTAARLAPLVAWADRNPVPGTTLRIVRQLLAVDVRDRVFGMAGQSFLAVIPLLIISSSWLSQSDGRALATALNPRLGLTGVTADTVLNFQDRATVFAYLRGAMTQEIGSVAAALVSDADVNAGLDLAGFA